MQAFWWRICPPVNPTAGHLGSVVEKNPRLIIRGDPGSGKTTILRYMSITCARSLRNDRRDGDDHNFTRLRLGWKISRFPIYVNLGLFANVLSWPKERRLLEGIVDTLPGELKSLYPKEYFEEKLRKGNCLVLFDGFDELGSRAARNKMAVLINDLANTYNRSTNRFIVSTRIVGYEGQLDVYGFSIRTVQDLDNPKIHDLVTRRYKAIALGEGLGLSEQEQKDLLTKYQKRADDLLGELQDNEGLRILTTNPLLLSLIVLVSLVRVKLPEQRHILYRDCVELLSQKWQEQRYADAGSAEMYQPVEGEVTLENKVSLLRDIALELQTRRKPGESQVLISRNKARLIIANRLPDFLAVHLPENENQQEQECWRRAGELLDNIRAESGILVEKGLDQSGELVIGFSHLTFQEYLAADAIHRRIDKLPLLRSNMFNPDWREVLLLYVSMENGTSIIQACLADKNFTLINRLLLTGRCLAEEGQVDHAVRQQVLGGLWSYFYPPGYTDSRRVKDLIWRVGGTKRYDWMLENMVDLFSNEERLSLERSLEDLETRSYYSLMQGILRRVMENDADINNRYQVGCILSAIGDPRELDEMTLIPGGEFWMGDDKRIHRLNLKDYEIRKYPVTNGEYYQFISETGHRSRIQWMGDQPPPWRSNQPVVSVNWHDANTFCEWLTARTGKPFHLPSEAQWEKAARGTEDKREWPWGDKFDPMLANTAQASGDWSTTPVGMYPGGVSPFGLMDMAGNVWEWCSSLYKPYPYNPDDGREEVNISGSRVRRGGAFYTGASGARCAARDGYFPLNQWANLGFRVVCGASPISPPGS